MCTYDIIMNEFRYVRNILINSWNGAQSGVVFKKIVTAFTFSFQRLKKQDTDFTASRIKSRHVLC